MQETLEGLQSAGGMKNGGGHRHQWRGLHLKQLKMLLVSYDFCSVSQIFHSVLNVRL